MWTCHVIEGLDDGRFAIFIKMHHSLTDGINGIRLATDQLALNPDGDWRAPWHAPTEQKPRKRSKASGSNSLGPLKTAAGVSRGLRTLRRGSEPVVLPFQAPASSRNLKVTNARRVATQRLEMTRMKAVANQTSTSLNDVLVAVCGDALRRYLIDHQQLPERSLVAGVPVSLREDGEHGGNAVGFLWADLGTDTDDPLQRLDAVHRSMTAAKEHLKTMPKAARPAFTMLTMVLPVATLLSGQAPRLLDRR